MTSRLASVTFQKMASKVFIEETDKISNLSRKHCSDFSGFGDYDPYCHIEKQTLLLFWNETSSVVMNFKQSFLSFLSSCKFSEDSYRFKGRCRARLRNLDTAVGGSSKDILGFKCAYF